jgi:hypothetical protein|tara:strand:- start:160 stop:954 length:795 start_codon:yes stop_codon:yes gene_type:complete
MSDLINLIETIAIKSNERFHAIQLRLDEKSATANNDIYPTIDAHGRRHAPCDAYIWDDVMYQGGAYLHTPVHILEMLEESGVLLGSFDSSKFIKRTKLKADLDIFNQIKRLCNTYKIDMEVKHGAVWNEGECYIYMSSKKSSLIEAIEVYAKEAKEAYFQSLRVGKGIAPVGKLSIDGVVLSIKEVEFTRELYRGHNETTISYKCIIQLENKSTVYGSVPAKIELDNLIGKTVRLTANFEHAQGDQTHSFYKRPSKASIVLATV